MSSLSYEKVCVLFNIAAMQSQVAAAKNADSEEEMKLSAKLFQVRGFAQDCCCCCCHDHYYDSVHNLPRKGKPNKSLPLPSKNSKLPLFIFQSASGIFSHLKTVVYSALQQDPTPDLQPETLSALASLMLAQAQEVITVHAIRGKLGGSASSGLLFFRGGGGVREWVGERKWVDGWLRGWVSKGVNCRVGE